MVHCPEPDFRAAMRRLAGTVVLVTTADGDDWHGMTATAISSLSVSPPSLLVCVNRSAALHPVLLRTRQFCVNLLSSDHQALAAAFGAERHRTQRFAAGCWTMADPAGPHLADAPAVLFCFVERLIDHHTHTVVLAGVRRALARPATVSLIYHDGGYGRPTPLPEVWP